MMSLKHPRDEILMSYAAGTLEEAHGLIVSCHLQFCSRCRQRVRFLEDVGSLLWENIPTVSVDAAFEKRVMTAFAEELTHNIEARIERNFPDPGDEYIMPGPLAHQTGLMRQTIPWVGIASAFQSARFPPLPNAKSELHFLNIGPGVTVTTERYKVEHFLLVLWGGCDTEAGRVQRGDFHEIEDGVASSLTGDRETGVVCVVASHKNVNDALMWTLSKS